LAGNLRWSWDSKTRELFREIDPSLFESVNGDPMRMLSEVPSARLTELATNSAFVSRVEAARADLHSYLTGDSWYRTLGDRAPKAIGYFSAEFGIATQLPQYSGGLGILAGDHLKAASDLGLPLVGVGLFYRAGYFRQSLSRDGWQEETYPVTDPDALPLALLREADGAPARVIIGLPGGRRLVAHIWVAHIGRVPLLLLDSNVEDNAEPERNVTDRLYGGGHDHRLLQEVLLGVGGVRALRVWSRLTGAPHPEVYHCNEGHAGFLGVERIRELTTMAFDFDSALEAVRSGTVFTTHTPVAAGIDRFDKGLIERFFGGDNAADGVPVDRILALGTEDFPGGDPAVFNMAVFGLLEGDLFTFKLAGFHTSFQT
jgi:starch phosphorylase